MSPILKTSEGGLIGADGNEQQGTDTARSIGAGRESSLEPGERCGDPRSELPADEAVVEAISGRGCRRAAAAKCGTGCGPGQAEEISFEGAAISTPETREVWGNVSGRHGRPSTWRVRMEWK